METVNIIIEMELAESMVVFLTGIIVTFIFAYLSTVLISRNVGKLRA